MSGFHSITKNVRRLEVFEKLDGTAVFGDDISLPGMLFAVGTASKYAFADIITVDTTEAKKAEGVVCVLTVKDIPGEKQMGEDVQDQYIFADHRVLFRGDIIALTVADTYEHAKNAANLVKVDYKVLPAITDYKKAINHQSIINPECPDNICSQCFIKKGDVNAALEQSDVVIDEYYTTDYQEHAYIEPEVVIAIPGRKDQEITVKGCMQNIFMPRLSIHRCLNIPFSKITIIATTIGGSFGGKLESPEVLAVRAALAALKTKRPVKYILTREESIEQSHKRHPFSFHIKVGATKDGKLKGFYAGSLADSGCYANMSPGVIFKAASLGGGAYNIPDVYCESKAIYTNNVPTGSMRGFGNPQAIFARESAITELAEKLGISPYQFRRLNVLHTADLTGSGQKLDFQQVGAEEVLDKVADAIDFDRKYDKYQKENSGRTRRRGVGLSLSYRGNSIGTGLNDIGRCYIEVEADGSVLLSIGFTEIGQGLDTTMVQIAAEALNINIERVNITQTNSSKSPLTGACIASRGTFIGGNAIIDAGRRIHKIMSEALSEHYNIPEEEVRFDYENMIAGNNIVSFEAAVDICYASGRTPASVGTYKVPELPFDEEAGYGDTYYEYTYSCIAAEVEVDICTGQTKVIKLVAAHDIGRAMNPDHANGQIIGGAVMSQGYGISEELKSVNGVISHQNFDEYKIPSFLDVNEVIPIIVENPDDRGPFGARSLGEPSLDPGAGAIINAINCALGELGKIRSLPASLENIMNHSGGE